MSIVRWCGHDSRGNPITRDEVPLVEERYHQLRKSESDEYDRLGFILSNDSIKNNILLPKYYNPEIDLELQSLSNTHDLVKIEELRDKGVIAIGTGVEIGKLAYGTGPIPFIRTSDISNWELKIDPKHGVDEDTYERNRKKAGVKEGDILLVRDGTYLIGTSCMITEYDTRILFQSHIYRIRVLKNDALSPYLLLALLNTPIVKKQIRARQFTQDIIDTLGARISEIVLPVPKDQRERTRIAEETRRIVSERAEL